MGYLETFSTTDQKISCAPIQKALMLNGHPVMEYHASDHRHPGTFFSGNNMLLVVTGGELHINYGRTEYLVLKNQIALIRNNTMVEYCTADGVEKSITTEFISFSLDYDIIREFTRLTQLSSMADDQESDIIIMQNNQLQKYIDSVLPYFDYPSKVEVNLIRIKLLELLFCLFSSCRKLLSPLLDLRRNYRPDITVVVEENLLNPLSVSELAELSGRSLSSFRRDFFSIYKMPPSQWIREKRLKKAKEFLLSTNMTITDICYTLGFENIAHFSRIFKSQFGQSPSACRLQLIAV